MELEYFEIWDLLILLLLLLITGMIGYIMGRKRKTKSEDNAVLQELKEENIRLAAELDNIQSKTSSATAANLDAAKTASDAISIPNEETFNPEAAKSAFGKRVKENDLKIVEGIGPKIEGLFHNHGIKTWKALSEVSTVKCQEVLSSGGDRYRIHDPASWPMQAKMAYKGQWKELAKWQDKHLSGKF